jgi:hypothetical protein
MLKKTDVAIAIAIGIGVAFFLTEKKIVTVTKAFPYMKFPEWTTPDVYNSPEVSGEIPEEELPWYKRWFNLHMLILRYGWNAPAKELDNLKR